MYGGTVSVTWLERHISFNRAIFHWDLVSVHQTVAHLRLTCVNFVRTSEDEIDVRKSDPQRQKSKRSWHGRSEDGPERWRTRGYW